LTQWAFRQYREAVPFRRFSARACGFSPPKHRFRGRPECFRFTFVIACGVLSIVYAAWAIQSVMAADAGNARMQEIAGPFARARSLSGAAIYDDRHRRRGVFILAWFLLSATAAFRLCHRRILSGWRVHRHARFSAGQCAHRAGLGAFARRRPVDCRSAPARSPACWSPASRCARSAV
jgi:hypothetical protein